MRRIASIVATALLAWTPRAHADAAADAKDLFEQGRKLRAAGDCASAVPLFHKAYDVYPAALGTLRNAAECEESLGRWASARRSWLDLKRATLFAHDARYRGWDEDARAAADRLAPRVPHLRVDVDAGGRGAADVTVNGERLAPELVGTTLDRDPGHYVIRAHVGAGAPAEETIDLATGDSRVVRLVVAPPPTSTFVRAVDVRPTSRGSAWTPAGWVALGVGLGAFVGMGIALGVRQDALSTLGEQCDYQHVACSPSLEPVVSRGQAASATVTALAVGGGIAAGAGILMLVLGAVAPRSEGPHVALSPWGASLTGSF